MMEAKVHSRFLEETLLVKQGTAVMNQYCLQAIFALLTPVGRVTVERVCKTWLTESKRSWNHQKNLELDPVTLGFLPYGKLHKIQSITHKIASEILKRCGKYTRKIELKDERTPCILDAISKYCCNVERILNVVASSDGLRCLADNIKCKNIVELDIRCLTPTRTDWDDIFGKIFYNNKNLKYLRIKNGNALKGYCFDKLTVESLNELSIQIPYPHAGLFIENLANALYPGAHLTSFSVCMNNCSQLSLSALSTSMLKNITNLDLSCLCYVEDLDEKLGRIFSRNESLERLRLYISCINDFTGECLTKLSRNIRDLEVDTLRCSVEPYLIICLPKFKHLTAVELEIAQPNLVSLISRSLSLCPKLQKLSLNLAIPTSNTLAEEISEISNLEYLKIFSQLENDVLENKFFTCIGRLSALKELHIGGYADMSEHWIEYLTYPSNIEHLSIVDIDLYNGYYLSDLKNLETFRCVDCPELEVDGLVSLIRVALNMKYIQIRGVDRDFREEIIDELVQLMKCGNNIHRMLVVDMDLYRVNPRLLRSVCKRLHLMDSDPEMWSSP